MTPNEVRAFLHEHVAQEFSTMYGVTDLHWIDQVTDAWLNDETNSSARYEDIERFLGRPIPSHLRILDMASGCGTFVFGGLRRGLDVWGIDPEPWKHTFNRMKSELYAYPPEWLSRFVVGTGESLPFPPDSFDVVSSYQTLEHVRSPDQCVAEIFRVLKPHGLCFIQAPDYRSTFEGHYRLPWLPLMPRGLARGYLRLLRRPKTGLETITYVTAARMKRLLSRYADEVISPNEDSVRDALRQRFPRAHPFLQHLLPVWKIKQSAHLLFRQERSIRLIARKGGTTACP